MIKYTFRDPITIQGSKHADPQVIGVSLEGIRVASGGALRPRRVWQEATPDDHPLHPHFEWDDAEAAKSYRDDQARALIRSIRVVDEDGDDRPAYLNVKDRGGHAYHSVENVLASADLRVAVLRAAERDLAAWQSRYRDLREIVDAVEPARQALRRKIEEKEVRPDA